MTGSFLVCSVHLGSTNCTQNYECQATQAPSKPFTVGHQRGTTYQDQPLQWRWQRQRHGLRVPFLLPARWTAMCDCGNDPHLWMTPEPTTIIVVLVVTPLGSSVDSWMSNPGLVAANATKRQRRILCHIHRERSGWETSEDFHILPWLALVIIDLLSLHHHVFGGRPIYLMLPIRSPGEGGVMINLMLLMNVVVIVEVVVVVVVAPPPWGWAWTSRHAPTHPSIDFITVWVDHSMCKDTWCRISGRISKKFKRLFRSIEHSNTRSRSAPTIVMVAAEMMGKMMVIIVVVVVVVRMMNLLSPWWITIESSMDVDNEPTFKATVVLDSKSKPFWI